MKTSVLSSSGCETTQLTVLVDWFADPVDAGISTDGLVEGVYEDDLKPLVYGVLSNPVRVEYTETSQSATSSVLSNSLQALFVVDLINTLVLGLPHDPTLVYGPLATSAAYSRAVDNKPLLGFVPQHPRLVRAGGTGSTHYTGQLSEFPTADPV